MAMPMNTAVKSVKTYACTGTTTMASRAETPTASGIDRNAPTAMPTVVQPGELTQARPYLVPTDPSQLEITPLLTSAAYFLQQEMPLVTLDLDPTQTHERT